MSIESGTLYIVATPIGNLGDLSPRAQEVLAEVDLIAAEDTRHTRQLLSHFNITTSLTALHDHNESKAAAGILQRLAEGQVVALVSDAGTPLISDPGYGLVHEAREHQLKVVPVPGPSAVIAALSVSGLPTDRFTFEGFPPRNGAARRALFEGLADDRRTLVFYESTHRLIDCLEDMCASFGQERRVVLARELTKRYETVHSALLADLIEWVKADSQQQRGEFVLMVAGAQPIEEEQLTPEQLKLLKVLLEYLPVKKAAAAAAEITGLKKNRLYQEALDLKGR